MYMSIDEEVVEEALSLILSGMCGVDDTSLESCTVRTYEEAGLRTYNRGIVIRLPSGEEFQLTIVQSR